MKYSLQILSALLLASGFVCAAEPFFIGPVRMEQSGSFSIDNQRFSLVHYTPAWQLSGQDAATVVPDPGYPKIEKGAFVLKGEYRTAGGKLRLEQSAVPAENGDRLDVTYRISAGQSPAATQALLVSTSLPRSEFAGRPIRIGGEELVLPETFSGQVLRGNIPAGTVAAFHRPDGGANLEVVSQNGVMNVLDIGKFEPRYEIRLNAPALPAPDRPAELRISVWDRSRGSRPLPLLAAANRGFADPVEGDGKGGWTDQGPTNDLSMLKPGTVRLGGVIFNIADPEKNDGKSCLVLTHAKDEQAEFAVDGRSDRYLYLLHSLAWVAKPNTLAGTLKVEYADGTDSQFEIRSGIDANDWWNPVNTPNGRIVWRFDKGKVKIGLSLSAFKLEGKPVKKLYFSSPKGVAWMIAAASTGNFPLPPGRDFPPYEIKAGKEWRPMVFEREILPGSAMDFSFLMDAPAGKHGFVTCRNGRFEFENQPGVPARFFGTNFCFGASFPDRETAELVAERLAAYGINAVRVHHQDSAMCENSKFSTELNEERMDKLDYFVYCLKKRGIYLSVDLFASRAVRKGEIPGIAGRLDPLNGAYKALVLIDPETRKNFLEFVGNWMNHVNAYTNLAWKDEPAILGMCIINEGNLDHWIKYANSAEVTRRYEAGFAQWLAKLPDPPKNEEERAIQYRRYLAQVHRDAHREMTDALRKMGVKVPLTDQNMRNWPRTTLMRQDYDYVDNHAYVDHPSGAMPSNINNRSTLDSFGAPAMTYAAGRIFGKPMMITEFNWCYPNAYRFESGVLMGACAAFQDWSGIFRFAYAHPAASLLHDRSTVAFETNTDPVNLLSDKIGALLFLRGDVAPAQTRNVLAVSPGDLDAETPYPDALAPLAWLTGLGSATTAEPAPAGTLDWRKPLPPKLPPEVVGKGAWNPDRSFVRSSTGEIEFDGADGKFRLMTEKSEVLMRPTPGKLSGKLLSTETFSTPAAVAAVSVDGKALSHSNRMLLFHLTDVLNDGDVFADRRRRIYEKVGDLPHLLRQGTANIRLRTGNAAESRNATVYALSFSGRRLREVPHRFEGGVLDFTADTACSPEGVMAYEVEFRH